MRPARERWIVLITLAVVVTTGSVVLYDAFRLTTDECPPRGTLAGPIPSGPAYPDPPDTLESETVTTVAIEYEEARLHEWGSKRYDTIIVGFYPSEATVVNRLGCGVYVRVHATYSYTAGDKHADGVAVDSLYFVDSTVIYRVRELSGSE